MTDKKAMKKFYIDKLGLELQEEDEHFFAAAAGAVRFSFFEGAKKYPINEDASGMSIVLRCYDITATRNELVTRGIKLLGDIEEAPGFMKYITLEDPDNNIIHIGEYLREPV
jgi:predicted enzyme related to lactoylglutathione lyase